jgi:hypothetical protein
MRSIEHHAYAVALHQMFYNFARVHQTLRVSPAMAAGVTDTLWAVAEIVGVIDRWEAQQCGEKPTFEIEPNKIVRGTLWASRSRTASKRRSTASSQS